MFSRSTGQLSWLGFQTFCSVPFLYELRQILDWSCTPTTLNLFDWLKLEVRTGHIPTVLEVWPAIYCVIALSVAMEVKLALSACLLMWLSHRFNKLG